MAHNDIYAYGAHTAHAHPSPPMPERVRLCCSEAASPSACWVCLCLSPAHVPLPACPASRATAEAGGWSAWSATEMWQKTVRSSYVPRRTKRRDGVMCSLHATALRLSRMSYVIRERVDCAVRVFCVYVTVCRIAHRASRVHIATEHCAQCTNEHCDV